MRLTVKNLGPIKEGTISLEKQLVVFTGPNNTGKSYLTYLIHGISEYETLHGLAKSVEDITPFFYKSEILRKAVESNSVVNVAELLVNVFSDTSLFLSNIIKNNLVKIFASSSIDADVFIEIGALEISRKNSLFKFLQFKDEEVIGIQWDGKAESISPPDTVFGSKLDSFGKACYLLAFFTSVYLDYVRQKRTYFFPAERTAINLFAKHITSTKAEIKDELDSEVIFGLTDEELGQRLRAQVKAAPKYPYAIREYINFVNNFKPNEDKSKFAFIADSMELALIGGKVYLDKFDQLIFTPKDSEDSLELHLSSSLVKSLSYLIMYLRYIAKEDDQIIIDEPELNLHPDIQVAIAKSIAEMVNAGLKVIISTHSDYLIKELNNLILLGKLNASDENTEFLIEHGYRKEHILHSSQVAAYFLRDHEINLINVEEDGLEVPSINEAIITIDSFAEEIAFRIEESSIED